MGWFSKKDASKTGQTFKDPVCGMDVTPETAFASAEHDGVKFYFCSQDCFTKFKANEHHYAHG